VKYSRKIEEKINIFLIHEMSVIQVISMFKHDIMTKIMKRQIRKFINNIAFFNLFTYNRITILFITIILRVLQKC